MKARDEAEYCSVYRVVSLLYVKRKEIQGKKW